MKQNQEILKYYKMINEIYGKVNQMIIKSLSILQKNSD